MNMVFRTLIVLAALAGLTETASAAGGIQFFYSNGSPGYHSSYYSSHYPGLQQRTYQRRTIHRNAYRHPVRHDHCYDHLGRRSTYYSPYTSGYYYNPYGSRLGIGYSTPGFSIRLSR